MNGTSVGRFPTLDRVFPIIGSFTHLFVLIINEDDDTIHRTDTIIRNIIVKGMIPN